MTLKHIGFYDSSVMRELERQAVKKNTPSPKLENIVKEAKVVASKINFYLPTDDLFADLVRLAEGLRQNGFIENAEVLESKILVYKQASSQYSPELSAAHPNGDVSMGEASNELGDVETLESAHEKILEVVKKQPTGKQANAVVANILRASEKALDIKKKAQDSGDESIEDLFSGRASTKAALITEINDVIATQFPKILSLLRTDIEVSKWIFKYQDLYAGSPEFRALYASYIGVDPIMIDRFFQQDEDLYGKNYVGDKFAKIVAILQELAQSKNINGLVNYGNSIGGDLGSRYFIGSQPSEAKREYAAANSDKANSQAFRDNSNSIWQWSGSNWFFSNKQDFVIDQNKLNEVARAIQQGHYDSFQSLFSEEKLTSATTQIQEQLKTILIPWNEVASFFNKKIELPTTATSSASLVMNVNGQIDKLKEYMEDGSLSKKLLQLARIMWPEWNIRLFVQASEAVEEIANTVNLLNSKPINPTDVIVTDINEVGETLFAIGKNFFTAAKTANPKSREFLVYTKNYEEIGKILIAVKNGVGKPYTFIYEKIKNSFPTATTYDKLVQEVKEFVQEYSDISAVAHFPLDSLLKQAQLIRKNPVSESNPTAPNSPATKPSTSKGTGAALGLAKANMNDPKEVAVATMQQHLAYFAEALATDTAKNKFTSYDPKDVALLVRTGPKANPAVNSYDGKWGTQTQTALDIANKYLKQLKLKELDTKARYTNRITSSDAESIAKSNSSLLSQATQVLGGRASVTGQNDQSGTLYDRLPEQLNWNEVKYPLLQHRISVTSKDLNNLGSLYDLVIQNNWLEPQYTQNSDGFDIEGLSARYWGYIIQWFQRRAQFVYNSSIRTDKEAAAVAREYYNAAKRLEGQLRSFFARYGYTSQNETDVIDIEALRQHSKGPGANLLGPEQNGERILERSPNNRVSRDMPDGIQYAAYKQKGSGDEGTDWKTPIGNDDDTPPIGPDGSINLASRWFHGLDQKLGIEHNPLLSWEVFRRYSAADLAKTFYASAGGNMDEQARRQALVATGVEVEIYDESAGDYIVRKYNPVTRRTERIYAMQVPEYQRAYKRRLMVGPIRSFGALLQSISVALGPAIAEWIREVQPNDTAKQAEQTWHTEWQKVLGLKANEAMGA